MAKLLLLWHRNDSYIPIELFMLLLMTFNQFELIFTFVKEMLQTAEKSQNFVKQLVFLLIYMMGII